MGRDEALVEKPARGMNPADGAEETRPTFPREGFDKGTG